MKIKKALVIVISSLIITAVFAGCFNSGNEEFLCGSVSPNQTYKLEAYLKNGGATVAFSVKVYLVKDYSKELVYNCYRESSAKIEWQNDYTVTINGHTLDLSKGETYDWRNDI